MCFPAARGSGTGARSDVIIEKELIGMRPEANFVDLARPLIVKVSFNYVLRKNVSNEKEFMVLLERIERFLKRSGR